MGTCQQNSYEAVHHSVSRQKYTISHAAGILVLGQLFLYNEIKKDGKRL